MNETVEYGWSLILEFAQSHKLLTSLFMVVLFLAVKKILIKLLRHQSKRRGEDKRHSINTIDQLGNALLVVLLLTLWANELQSLALSIAAFMVAIVFATRELIQCFIGFVYYMTTRPFRVGNWVQLGNHVGEVVELDWAKTTLLEVDPESYTYTGKHVYVPNNQLMNQVVKNLNFLRRYRLHNFQITNEPFANPYVLLAPFQATVTEHCAHFRVVAERYKSLIERNLDAGFISIDPEIEIVTNHLAKIIIKIGLFCPSDEAFTLEQKIRADWSTLWFNEVQRQQKENGIAGPILQG